MITEKDFDWSVTQRDLVIFCPNWNRGNYLRHTVKTIETSIPKDRWMILVANDGPHEDLSDLEDYNVKYFTLPRPDISERNGCFVRNLTISRLQSERVFIKDPEIIIKGDFIKSAINSSKPFYRLGGYAYKTNKETTLNYMDGKASIHDCIQNSNKVQIIPNKHVNMHYGYSMPVNILQEMRGYDEDYCYSPYCEDQDMFLRLISNGFDPFVDPECFPIHLWHPMMFFPNDCTTKAMYDKSKKLLASKDPKQFVRNLGREWGTGRVDICNFTKF